MLHQGRRELEPDWVLAAVFGFRVGCAVLSVSAFSFAAVLPLASANGEPSVHSGMTFSIPAQPLGPALETFVRLSGREVLYDGALAIGRRSSLIEGFYAPEVALQVLLAGTGLRAEFMDADFFILAPVPVEKPATVSSDRASAEQLRYYGRLQASLKGAFCGSTLLPVGNRIAARLWIDRHGDVLQVKNLASPGNGDLDRQIDKALRGLRLGGPPPPDFAQPITIVIMPGDGVQDCGSRQPREARQ
jgi:hypothetical protein